MIEPRTGRGADPRPVRHLPIIHPGDQNSVGLSITGRDESSVRNDTTSNRIVVKNQLGASRRFSVVVYYNFLAEHV